MIGAAFLFGLCLGLCVGYFVKYELVIAEKIHDLEFNQKWDL